MAIKIGVQGGLGSFNDEAVAYYLASRGVKEFEIQYLYTTAAVLKAVSEKRIDYGQFALYNSYAGPVEESIRLIGSSFFHVQDWYSIPVAHYLMCHRNADAQDIDTIMAHPQALLQCRKNLEGRYPHHNLVSGTEEMADGSRVAAALQEGLLPNSTAVLGCRSLAAHFGLKIVADELQDVAGNTTTFLLVSPFH